jgi:hypothetical protein
MDLNTTGVMTQGVKEGIVAGFIYDVASLAIAFILVKIIYEKLYMKWKWGGWRVKICENSTDGGDVLVDRKLSIQAAKRILEDRGEFSIYVKGIVSPYAYLNIDIASDEAEEIGLIQRDIAGQEIVVDLSKNPPPKRD